MVNSENLRQVLQVLREKSNLSQTELAKRLPYTASRVSRLESGDLTLDVEEAVQVAEAIGSDESRAFAEYLQQDWQVLDPVAFHHVSRGVLWEAELALQRLRDLREDPDIRNVFLKQIESCEEALYQKASFISSTEHPIAFIGSPGVGKTTAICSLADLRDPSEEDLNRQMALQTGSGRTTICEVHVKYGGEYAVSIEPCSDEELRYHVADFCDHVLAQAGILKDDTTTDGPGISIEIARALRRMSQLVQKKVKGENGKTHREDPAIALAHEYPDRDELQIQVLQRLNLPRRKRTSVSYPRDSAKPGFHWLSKTFADINYGAHPEFSLPRRIEVSVPNPVLNSTAVEPRLIDTRGVDEPSAPRRDLQSYLDDDRSLIVLCSGFKDAPDAAVQSVIERASAGGNRRALIKRGVMLILTQGEENAVRDSSTGELVDDEEEGRDVRREQARSTTLGHLGVSELPIEFMNVAKADDCKTMQQNLIDRVMQLRGDAEEKIRSLIETTDRLIANKENEQVRAVFEQATRMITTWLDSNFEIRHKGSLPEEALLEEMDGLRYASTLRASVARQGSWPNFDFWHGLGFGARREAVVRTSEQLIELKGVVQTILNDEELAESHDFVRHFLAQVEEVANDYFQKSQTLGETAFASQLKGTHDYWSKCQDRWGQGSGYKIDIHNWTGEWFSNEARDERHEFIETELQRLWRESLTRLAGKLRSADPETSSVG
ncbi:helix-turn-helix domain-containing protein [Gimesia sp.]|uniref:helix-turn-helix domain-containing protein n=1 Tax=Gimesia sp. TaxID=2024833 RepID=UPI003A8F80D4